MSANQSSSAQEALRALGQRLREIRIEAGLTGRALASLVGWHESKVSKVEYGRQPPSVDDIRAWCRHSGVPGMAGDLIASLRAVEGMFVEWRRMERTGLRKAQESVLPLWERTKRFRAYNAWLVPGILQTRDYTKAALESIASHRGTPDDIDEAVDVRMAKQRVLYTGGRRFAVLLEEPVLRYRLGGSDTMRGQLEHLIALSSLPAVSLGIIPMRVDRVRWPVEGFWVFDDSRVNVELVSGWLTVTHPNEVAMYLRAFSDMANIAVHGSAARRLITVAIETL
ncbi:helix-turn-helix domain-containing protein [Catellatospora citrea]|uniref:Transcriptional regulator n=1 Tax=Catellatospora citrea TaxID=53366 RepID=A0A8J3KB95_9ACTN|nr:helix-turn-helix transcriptional regulator [Catellatospora citrea]RKE11314.1 helix-turn-helix protein [Catellatospora citrea]GIF96781.1 transcriptional regulator [Catellatospora citrea]